MPKCEQCQYLTRTSYEYGEYECRIFGEWEGTIYENGIETGKNNGMFFDGGCKYHHKTLKKKLAVIEKYKDMDAQAWYEWGLKTDKEHYKKQADILRRALKHYILEKCCVCSEFCALCQHTYDTLIEKFRIEIEKELEST